MREAAPSAREGRPWARRYFMYTAISVVEAIDRVRDNSLPCLALPESCHAVPCPSHALHCPSHAMPCHAQVMPCHVIPSDAMPCYAMPIVLRCMALAHDPRRAHDPPIHRDDAIPISTRPLSHARVQGQGPALQVHGDGAYGALVLLHRPRWRGERRAAQQQVRASRQACRRRVSTELGLHLCGSSVRVKYPMSNTKSYSREKMRSGTRWE